MQLIHDKVDLLIGLARCLEERDDDALKRLEREIGGWLQPARERDAQLALINAIREAIDAIED